MTSIPLSVENTLNGKRYNVSVMAGKDGIVTAKQFLKHFSRQLQLDASAIELRAAPPRGSGTGGSSVPLGDADPLPTAGEGTVEVVPKPQQYSVESAAPPQHQQQRVFAHDQQQEEAFARPPLPQQHHQHQQQMQYQQRQEEGQQQQREQKKRDLEALVQRQRDMKHFQREEEASRAEQRSQQQLMKHSLLAGVSPKPEYQHYDPYHPSTVDTRRGGGGSSSRPPTTSAQSTQKAAQSKFTTSFARQGAAGSGAPSNAGPPPPPQHPTQHEEFLTEEQIRRELMQKCDKLASTKEQLGEELELLGEQMEADEIKRKQDEADRHARRHAEKLKFESQEAELLHQIEVVETLIQEDSVEWKKEVSTLKHEQVQTRERQIMDTLQRDVNMRSQQVRVLEREVDHVSKDTLELKESLFHSRERVNLRKEEVAFASASLDEARDKLLRSLGEAGRLGDRDKEAAQFVATTSAQLHLLQAQVTALSAQLDKFSLQKESLVRQRKWLHHSMEEAKGHIRVVVRLRPTLPSDATTPHNALGREEEATLEADTLQGTIKATSPTVGLREFEFFSVYGPPQIGFGGEGSLCSPEEISAASEEQQGVIFKEQVAPLLQSLLDGSNVCVMAYGQTGSGKTFTILGEKESTASNPNASAPDVRHRPSAAASSSAAAAEAIGGYRLTGMLPQCLRYLFDSNMIAPAGRSASIGGSTTTLTMSMVELYLDDVYDLLSVAATGSTKKCEVRMLPQQSQQQLSQQHQYPGSMSTLAAASKVSAGGASIVGALEVALESEEHAVQLLKDGLRLRQTHKTLRNAHSSRSHLILTISLVVSSSDSSSSAPATLSKLVFVDLAGSERVSRSLSSGDRLKEALHINKSLSSLGDVMAALSSTAYVQKQQQEKNNTTQKQQNGVQKKGSVYVPYRNSKLTSILQNCLGGSSKTLLITCICPHIPHQHNLAESLSTLGFASRTKLVRNMVQKRKGIAPTAAAAAAQLYPGDEEDSAAAAAAQLGADGVFPLDNYEQTGGGEGGISTGAAASSASVTSLRGTSPDLGGPDSFLVSGEYLLQHQQPQRLQQQHHQDTAFPVVAPRSGHHHSATQEHNSSSSVPSGSKHQHHHDAHQPVTKTPLPRGSAASGNNRHSDLQHQGPAAPCSSASSIAAIASSGAESVHGGSRVSGRDGVDIATSLGSGAPGGQQPPLLDLAAADSAAIAAIVGGAQAPQQTQQVSYLTEQHRSISHAGSAHGSLGNADASNSRAHTPTGAGSNATPGPHLIINNVVRSNSGLVNSGVLQPPDAGPRSQPGSAVSSCSRQSVTSNASSASSPHSTTGHQRRRDERIQSTDSLEMCPTPAAAVAGSSRMMTATPGSSRALSDVGAAGGGGGGGSSGPPMTPQLLAGSRGPTPVSNASRGSSANNSIRQQQEEAYRRANQSHNNTANSRGGSAAGGSSAGGGSHHVVQTMTL